MQCTISSYLIIKNKKPRTSWVISAKKTEALLRWYWPLTLKSLYAKKGWRAEYSYNYRAHFLSVHNFIINWTHFINTLKWKVALCSLFMIRERWRKTFCLKFLKRCVTFLGFPFIVTSLFWLDFVCSSS